MAINNKVGALIDLWEKRNIVSEFLNNKEEAVKRILDIVPESSSVGFCGSQTLDQMGIIHLLEARKNKVFNQYRNGISREQSLELRNLGAGADYFLTSVNSISLSGELIFFSGWGHRIAGISNAKNVIVVSGINKVTGSLDEALKRAREYSTPLNCKRLNWNSACLSDGICRKDICQLPEYKRMCCQVLIIEAEVIRDRLKVLLINKTLGY